MERFDFTTGPQELSWRKHVIEKHVLPHQTGFLSGQNLSRTGQMTSVLTKLFAGLEVG